MIAPFAGMLLDAQMIQIVNDCLGSESLGRHSVTA